MFHGGAKHSTESVKCSMVVLNIRRRLSNVPRRCYISHGEFQMFHGEGQMVHGGAKYSTDNAKYSTEVLNIPRRGSNVPRR